MTSAVTFRTADAAATRALARAFAGCLRAGDTVALSGELGAGKTCFVQGAAEALGISQRITSPTFVLCKTYGAPIPVVHADVYRLDRVGDLADLGEDLFAADVVTFLEWGDAVPSALPGDRFDVELLHEHPTDPDGTGRWIRVRASGSATNRAEAVVAACGTWREEP